MKFRRFKNDFLTGLAAWEIKDTNEIYGLDDTILGNDDHLADGLNAEDPSCHGKGEQARRC